MTFLSFYLNSAKVFSKFSLKLELLVRIRDEDFYKWPVECSFTIYIIGLRECSVVEDCEGKLSEVCYSFYFWYLLSKNDSFPLSITYALFSDAVFLNWWCVRFLSIFLRLVSSVNIWFYSRYFGIPLTTYNFGVPKEKLIYCGRGRVAFKGLWVSWLKSSGVMPVSHPL